MNNKVLTVGSLAFDTIETPFTKIGKTMGGAASYSALATSIFDVEQTLVSVVGEDYPSSFMQVFIDREIDISGVEIVKGEDTFFWSGRYKTNMNERETLETKENVLRDYTPILPLNFRDASFILLGNLSPKTQLQVLEQLENPKLILLDTMNYWIEHSSELLEQVISKIDVLCINEEEAQCLTKERSLIKMAKILQDKGVSYIIIKRGEYGAMLFHQDKCFFTPALPLIDVCDPTGAGYTFAGGFIGYIAKTGDTSFENMKNALAYATTLASFCVENIGTERLLTVSKEEVLRRLFCLKELTQFDINIV